MILSMKNMRVKESRKHKDVNQKIKKERYWMKQKAFEIEIQTKEKWEEKKVGGKEEEAKKSDNEMAKNENVQK